MSVKNESDDLDSEQTQRDIDSIEPLYLYPKDVNDETGEPPIGIRGFSRPNHVNPQYALVGPHFLDHEHRYALSLIDADLKGVYTQKPKPRKKKRAVRKQKK